jgi:hypothetical protein
VRRAVAAVAAVVLVSAATPLVAGGSPARAARAVAEDGLTVTTKVTYRYDPAVPSVVVDTELTLLNESPPVTQDNVVRRAYWRSYGLVAVKEANGFHADTSDGRGLGVTTEPAPSSDQFLFVDVDLGRNLFYRDSITLKVSYTIPATLPRTGGMTRVNTAFAMFGAFVAGGDAGRTAVEVVVPADFETVVDGTDMDRNRFGDTTVYSSGDVDPATFYAGFSIRNDDALINRDVDLRPITVHVRAWPGDDEWADFVHRQVAEGVPALERLSGLRWPSEDTVEIIESVTPYLYGYAGWYQPVENLIEVGDELDQHVILHELSHVWLNDDMFRSRWIVEGMAEELSSQAEAKLGATPEAAALPPATHAGHQPLNTWSSPDLQDDSSRDDEEYGYAAAYAAIHQIAQDLGADGLRAVIHDADAKLTAYPGDAPAEKQSRPPDWQRFLDLIEEHGGSSKIVALFRDVVVADADERLLDQRAKARAAYTALESDGGAWAPPLLLRRAMGDWQFDRAGELIAQADRALGRRAALQRLTRRLDLDEPARLEAAYEGADTPLPQVRSTIDRSIEGAEAIARAEHAVDESSGPLAALGGLLSSADDDLAHARTSFEDGDASAARQAADRAADAADAEAGRGGLIVGVAAGIVALATVGSFLLLRRSRRPGAPAPSAPSAPADWGDPGPAASDCGGDRTT